MPPGGIVEAFDEAEAGHACLDLRGKAAPLEQFAFEGGEEALAQGVVPRVRLRRPEDRLRHPRPSPSKAARRLPCSACRKPARYIGCPIGMMDHLSRPTLAEGHVQSIQDQLGSQMVG